MDIVTFLVVVVAILLVLVLLKALIR